MALSLSSLRGGRACGLRRVVIYGPPGRGKPTLAASEQLHHKAMIADVRVRDAQATNDAQTAPWRRGKVS